MMKRSNWFAHHWLWLELFALVNLAGLAPDIFLAHSTNAFDEWSEYVPLVFSLVAPVLLLIAIVALQLRGPNWFWRWFGGIVGWASIGIGIVGLILHLESRFFEERTLASLVYAAPFAAPLSYAGIGLLLVMNRMVDHQSREWPRWVLRLALIGFVGNFVFSVTDHAQNGFYHWTEWIPVASSALAIGFVTALLAVDVKRSYVVTCTLVLLLQGAVGLLGFYYHFSADLRGPSPTLFENVVFGAPVMAPLLFPNLMLLALLGLYVMFHANAPDTARSLDSGGLRIERSDSAAGGH